MLRRTAAVIFALLVVFHGWLFGSQLLDGRLLEPWLVLRWLGAVALGIGFLLIRSHGAAPARRRAVTLWLLAALLHGPAFFDGTLAPPQAVSEAAAAVVQITAFAVGAGLLFACARARRFRVVLAVMRREHRGHAPSSARHFISCSVAPRPPPLASIAWR